MLTRARSRSQFGDQPSRSRAFVESSRRSLASCGSDRRSVGIVEERLPVGSGDELRARLAVAVGVAAALRLVFAEWLLSLWVLVDLVRRHVDEDPDTAGAAHSFQEVHRAHDVRL